MSEVNQRKSIGLLGGTFDPVHLGHLHLAKTVFKELELDEIRLIPLSQPPHRSAPIATQEQRLTMLDLATADHAGLMVDDCEIQREEVSYTVHTLQDLRKINEEASLCFILGADNFRTINTWYQWKSLIELAHLVIVNRPGQETEIVDEEVADFKNQFSTDSVEALKAKTSGGIYKLEIEMLDVSSTQIRNNLQMNQETHHLLPDKVLDFIQQQNIYAQ